MTAWFWWVGESDAFTGVKIFSWVTRVVGHEIGGTRVERQKRNSR